MLCTLAGAKRPRGPGPGDVRSGHGCFPAAFFIGDGLLQLVADRQSGAAGLPPGQKAWASLTALGEVDFFAHANEIDDLLLAGIELLVPLEALQVGAMPAYQADHQVLVV